MKSLVVEGPAGPEAIGIGASQDCIDLTSPIETPIRPVDSAIGHTRRSIGMDFADVCNDHDGHIQLFECPPHRPSPLASGP